MAIARSTSFATLALVLLALPSCSDDGDAGAAGSSSGGGESTGELSATAGMSSTSAGTTVGTSASTSADTGGSSDSGADSNGFVNPQDTGSDGPAMPQPNGGQCANNEGCESGFCYTIPQLGGICSECLVDADCGTGTCSLDAAAMYAICTDGSIGKQCNSDEGCMGDLVCTELIDTGGLFNANFCSECGPQAPCAGDQVCAPVYDLGNFGGYMACVDPGSVADGGGCPLDGGVGDGTACMSGHCGVADVFMGLLQLGICGECDTDADCPDGMTCTPPQIGMGGVSGATCG